MRELDLVRGYVLRIEKLDADITALNRRKAEAYDEAKTMGLDQRVLRRVLERRRMAPHEQREQDALVRTYEEAVRRVALEDREG